MNYQTLTLLQNLAHWWDSSLGGRLLLWLVIVYGTVSVSICLVELLQDIFKRPLDPDELPSLMALWFTLLIVLVVCLSGQHIVENLPRDASLGRPAVAQFSSSSSSSSPAAGNIALPPEI